MTEEFKKHKCWECCFLDHRSQSVFDTRWGGHYCRALPQTIKKQGLDDACGLFEQVEKDERQRREKNSKKAASDSYD